MSRAVLVCGGRDFRDYNLLTSVLDELHREEPIWLVVHGDARGADRLAGLWATCTNVAVHAHPARWDLYGRAAGPIRNRAMLESQFSVDLVVAFPGGHGTEDMVKQARAKGVPVLEVPPRQSSVSEPVK